MDRQKLHRQRRNWRKLSHHNNIGFRLGVVTMNQSEFEGNACSRRQARENTCERGTTGSGLKIERRIIERSKAKPKQTRRQLGPVVQRPIKLILG